MKRQIFLLLFMFTYGAILEAQIKPNVNKKPYPYDNPVITHMYTADAAPHVMPDGRVWMVTSVDLEAGGGYSTMHSYHTFSSADMVNWTDHGEVLHINDLIGGEEPENEDWALWAPDMIYRNGKYYLYFPLRILHTGEDNADGERKVTSYIAVAESEAPDKKFKVINEKIEGTRGIDPAVFIDDDGTPYLFFGPHMGAPLKDNMKELASEPVRMDVGTDKFMEAIWMHKRKGKYYVSYHTKYNWQIELDEESINDPERDKSELAYSVGESPLGPFEFKGVLNYEPGVNVKNGPKSPEGNFVPWRLTLSNHGGVVEYHGQDYLFYHTSALSSWRQDEFQGRGTWTQRSVCVDYLNYNPDGTVIPVQQTIESVDKIQINQPFAINLDCKKAKRTNNIGLENNAFTVAGEGHISYKKINMGTGYYYFEVDIEKPTQNARIEIRKGSSDGLLMGTLLINNESTLKNSGKAQTFLREANGTDDIYLVVKNPGNEMMKFSNPRFFAGSPKKINK